MTRFDAGSEDRNGEVFSVRQRRLGHGEYCFGTVKLVYSSRRGEQKYRVLWDGDATQMQSGETHLEPEGEVNGPAADVHEHDDADTPAAEYDLGGNSVTTIFVMRIVAYRTCVFFHTHLRVHPRRPPGHHQRHSRRG